ncbi:MAG: serine protease [bacterium]|nr:MAG: serine protease [bacterium]
MKGRIYPVIFLGLFFLFLWGRAGAGVPNAGDGMRIGSAVGRITVYNWKGSFMRNGWGFFIDDQGSLVTWGHLLEGGSFAEVTTSAGETVTLTHIVHEDRETGLVVAGLEYPPDRITFIRTQDRFPGEGDRVLVGGGIGCDPGSYVDGRVLSVRDVDVFGSMARISSPFATSGSPVFNRWGKLVGMVFLKPEGSGDGSWAVPVSGLAMLVQAERKPVEYAQWSDQDGGGWLEGNTGAYLAGFVYYWAGDFENALSCLARAARDERFAREAHFLIGGCNDGLARYSRSVDAYAMAIALGSRSSEAHLRLARAYRETGDLESAIGSCWEAIRIEHEKAEAFLLLSAIYNALGNFQNALAASYAAIRLLPDSAEAYLEAGISLRSMNRFPDAVRLFRKAMASQPEWGIVYWHLALTYYYSGDLPSAMETCEALRPIDGRLAERLQAGLRQ